MLGIGISGGFDPVHESQFGFTDYLLHDAAVVLVEDGHVIAAIEQERIDRIKHSNKIWSHALRFCLDKGGYRLQDLDFIAIYVSEPFLNQSLMYMYLNRSDLGDFCDAREMYQRLFQREFQVDIAREKFHFVHHHIAHAACSYYMSGFNTSDDGDCLILSIDGAGDNVSTVIVEAKANQFEILKEYPVAQSLGFYYTDVIKFLGYGMFDEYKIMGLAPYGDSNRFQEIFSTFYSLLADGGYEIYVDRIYALYQYLTPRKRNTPFEQIHKDIAAALQKSLETIIFHILSHYQKTTGQSRLCLSGGVAQNSSMNGKIVSSGLFMQVFAPAFSGDSGCSYGAAMHASKQITPELNAQPPIHTNWGSEIPDDEQIAAQLSEWSDFIDFNLMDNREQTVAKLIDDGAVIGWVQGRSEFGPRALGNRSILADPRRESHKRTINAMVKKRESYRPFAPSVLEQKANDYFVMPEHTQWFPYMSCVFTVRPEWQDKLAAITHVDGTARVQTVSRDSNPAYWDLISAFGERTGVSMLLNTSFNNNAEPIVDSLTDAVVCYLTTGLDYLVAGNYLITKKEKTMTPASIAKLSINLPVAAQLLSIDKFKSLETRHKKFELRFNYDPTRRADISPLCFRLLNTCDGSQSINALLQQSDIHATELDSLFEELSALWSERMVILSPTSR